jgi:hypothetical protein
MYYRGGLIGGKLTRKGEQGEYTVLDVNQYKAIINNILNMTTNQKPVMDPVATNTDTKSIAQTKLAKGLLDYYLRSKRVARYVKNQVKHGLLYGEGWLMQVWDDKGGQDDGVNPETGALIKEGDVKYKTILPHFVCRDVTQYNHEDHNWYITTTFENKYDLAARYPELRDQILNICRDYSSFYTKLSISEKEFWTSSDDIEVYTLVHRTNEVMPEGRLTICLAGGLVLFDGPIPYRTLPLYCLAPERQEFSCFGYSVGFDLLAIQEAIINLYSTACTNNATFGVQNILMPRGYSISFQNLAEGLNVIEYDPQLGKPEALQLTLTSPELFRLIEMLENLMQMISGVNSVSMGQPEASLKSGTSLALVQAMAIQSQSGIQQSYVDSLEDIATNLIELLKDFASVPRVAMIAGKYSKSYMKEFKGGDLGSIQRVTVDMGNPLSRTLAGRTQIAQNLLEGGFIKDADQYITVLETGTLDPILQGPMMEQYQIRQENELLGEGQDVTALITDKHAEHIMEHKHVLSAPESRKDPTIVQKTLKHIMDHVGLLKTADPALLQILGQQAIAPTPPAPPTGEATENDALPPEGTPTGVLPQVEPINDVTAKAATVQEANMPKNALTGQEFNTQTGGL